jgi:hypothetical protein
MVGIISSCDKETENNTTPTEQENTVESMKIDMALNSMFLYHDSCSIAKMHSSQHLHHYDSIYHHHDSLYKHHHNTYHHGDTVHHHSGWHHGTNQHHSHDSLNTAHHHSIH